MLGMFFPLFSPLVSVCQCDALCQFDLSWLQKIQTITLLDELDKDRNQLDCFSFSVEAGDWEAESSILGFLEAGGSEETWNKDRQEKIRVRIPHFAISLETSYKAKANFVI